MVDENSTFGGFLTDIGEARQSNANALRIPWKLTHMLLGDANGTDPVPDPAQAGLINQRYRGAINQLSVDPANPGILIAELVLPPDVGGWWIRELGIEDDSGAFVAVANCAPSYKPLLAQGSGRNQVVRMHLILSNTANVELKIDPSIVLATRANVDDEIAKHAESRNHPLATMTEKGLTQYATIQEHLDGQRADRAAKPSGVKGAIDARIADQPTVDTGDDDTKFITPKKLKAWAANWVKSATELAAGMLKIATQEQVDAGTDDATAVTPKKLRWGVSYSISSNGYLALPSWLGGLIIQWGVKNFLSVSGGSFVNIDLPIPFPSDFLTGVVSNNTSQASNTDSVSIGELRSDSFDVIWRDGGNRTVRFFVLGK